MKSSFTLTAIAVAMVAMLSISFTHALPSAELTARNRRPSGQIFNVLVGGPNIFAFTPAFVFAKPGDTIIFEFLQNNHSVTQSSYEAPCKPLDGGADSGFMFNPQGLRGGFDFTMTIPMEAELEEPFFFYCGQGDHCAKRGMVFMVNPNVQFSFTEFFKKAIGLK